MEREEIIAAAEAGLNNWPQLCDGIDIDLARAIGVLDAIEPLIRADEREQVCRREGHNAREVTNYTNIARGERDYICGRCGATKTETLDGWEVRDGA